MSEVTPEEQKKKIKDITKLLYRITTDKLLYQLLPDKEQALTENELDLIIKGLTLYRAVIKNLQVSSVRCTDVLILAPAARMKGYAVTVTMGCLTG